MNFVALLTQRSFEPNRKAFVQLDFHRMRGTAGAGRSSFSGCRCEGYCCLDIFETQTRKIDKDFLCAVSSSKAGKYGAEGDARSLENRLSPAHLRITNDPVAEGLSVIFCAAHGRPHCLTIISSRMVTK